MLDGVEDVAVTQQWLAPLFEGRGQVLVTTRAPPETFAEPWQVQLFGGLDDEAGALLMWQQLQTQVFLSDDDAWDALQQSPAAAALPALQQLSAVLDGCPRWFFFFFFGFVCFWIA